MKKLFFTLLALCLVFAVEAKGTEDTKESDAAQSASAPVVKELTWARAYETTTLDAAKAADDNSMNIISYTSEGLTRIIDGQIVPGLAESWEVSEDGKSYILHLRESTWSDGSPLTAHDFVYSFFRLIDPRQGHSQASAGYMIKNAQAFAEGTAEKESVGYRSLDDVTLEIVFKDTGLENLYFLAQAHQKPVNETLIEKVGTAYGSEIDAYLSNGPFVITEWLHENRIVLEKNALYWNPDAIRIDKLIGLANVADDTAVEMMQTGIVDLAPFKDPAYYGQLLDAGFRDTAYSNSYTFLHINHAGKSEETGRLLANENFRRALNFALDRTALALSVLPGQQPANRLVDPGMAGVSGAFTSEYPVEAGLNITADREKAREYLNLALNELDMTAADIPEFSMLCYESQTSQNLLQACQDMFLTNLGIKSVIDPQPIQQMLGKVFSFDYDFWYGGIGSGSVDIASNNGVLGYWASSNPNALFGYSNETYNDLLETAQTTLDQQERKDTIAAMENIFCEEIPDLLLAWQTVHAVYRDGIVLNGISKSYGSDLAFAEVTKNK